jgi:2-polyprenyl-3-methyl-5-hydroxy-6-metoxy-1,4-benzoquinol methylase
MKKNTLEIWNLAKSIDGDSEIRLGPYTTRHLLKDPKHFGFFFSRYKFAGKMIGEEGNKKVLDIGCGEGIGSLILSQFSQFVTGIDFDEKAIEWATTNLQKSNLRFICKNIFSASNDNEKYDVIVALDMIEHIEKNTEDDFIKMLLSYLDEKGFIIIGTPNISSLDYATEASRIAHINLYDFNRLKKLLLNYFEHAFCFGMNDEVLHTGFYPMCHYILIIACTPRTLVS